MATNSTLTERSEAGSPSSLTREYSTRLSTRNVGHVEPNCVDCVRVETLGGSVARGHEGVVRTPSRFGRLDGFGHLFGGHLASLEVVLNQAGDPLVQILILSFNLRDVRIAGIG